MDALGDAAIFDHGAQLRRRKRAVEADGHLCAGPGGEEVPGFRLAVVLAEGARKRIIGMHLDRQGLSGEHQFEQQRRLGRMRIGALEPEFADGAVDRRDGAPRQQVAAAPWLANHAHKGPFDCHDRLLDRAAEIGTI
ncbi:MAG: hypothetical protein B7Z41_04245 [Rhizobiales bacterium 12-66-7]|nr:MAG: hypothetical protein B7Z41_04245 [Rhizobiales bacterium 12-66-7]